MKRRNLCNTKKLMAVILAASMVMSSGVTAFAEEFIGTVSVEDNSTVTVAGDSKDSGTTVSGDVKGGVYARSEDNDDSAGKDATAKVTVDGDVTEDNSYTAGVNAVSNSYSSTGTKASTDVTVKGSVDVKADNAATGVSAGAFSYGTNSNASTTVEVKEDVTAVSGSYDSAVGLDVVSKNSEGNGKASADVHVGSVTVESDEGGSTGITVAASSKNSSASSTVNVTVDEDVNASTSKGYASGIILGANDSGSSAKVTVGGDIDAVSNDTSEKTTSTAKGIVTAYDGYVAGEADVLVKGDINATNKNGYAEGITIESPVTGTLNIDVGGSVTQDGSDGWAIALPDSSDGNITITVGEAVTATTTAVNIINGYDSGGKVELTVGGEISGGKNNIVLNNTASLDDVSITVWKVDTSDGKNVVDKAVPDEAAYKADYEEWDAAMNAAVLNKDEDEVIRLLKNQPEKSDYKKYEQDTEAEKKVNYIISVQSDVSIAKGTRKVNGYNTARQDETVTFAVTVPSGYEIENFFNVSPGNIISLSKGSADGTYLLTVPRGGGVDIGVTMKKIQNDAQSTTTNQSGVQVQIASTSSDNSKKHESDETTGTTGVQNWSVGNYSDANAAATMQAIQGLQVHALNLGGAEMVQNVADVLTPVDTITALNNFSANNVSTMGINNIMGAGMVDFKSMFLTAVTDTVDVPVAASVAENQYYTVMFSDGTSVVVQCLANGVLNIPFNKNAEGLTYIIYGLQMDPTMSMGMPATSEWTY